MKVLSADFIISNTDFRKCPPPKIPEYAFIGRSNVGKSSLINLLTGNKRLAKTSGKPGKTQLINHFLINKEWYLVDLPGYGFAKTSKKNRKSWERFVEEYLIKRQNLIITFVLIDSRLEPQQIDLEFISWLGTNELPFALVFTKTDKISKNVFQKNKAVYKKELLKTWEVLPPMFDSSSVSEAGKEELLEYIDKLNKEISPNFENLA